MLVPHRYSIHKSMHMTEQLYIVHFSMEGNPEIFSHLIGKMESKPNKIGNKKIESNILV